MGLPTVVLQLPTRRWAGHNPSRCSDLLPCNAVLQAPLNRRILSCAPHNACWGLHIALAACRWLRSPCPMTQCGRCDSGWRRWPPTSLALTMWSSLSGSMESTSRYGGAVQHCPASLWWPACVAADVAFCAWEAGPLCAEMLIVCPFYLFRSYRAVPGLSCSNASCSPLGVCAVCCTPCAKKQSPCCPAFRPLQSACSRVRLTRRPSKAAWRTFIRPTLSAAHPRSWPSAWLLGRRCHPDFRSMHDINYQ